MLSTMQFSWQQLGSYLKGLLMGWPAEDIPDNDRLYRRIPPVWYNKEEDRVTSAAFKDLNMSVNWEKYITAENAVRKYPEHRLSALIAKVPRSKSLEVKHTPSRLIRSHSSIIGKKTESIARFLAQNSVLVVKSI